MGARVGKTGTAGGVYGRRRKRRKWLAGVGSRRVVAIVVARVPSRLVLVGVVPFVGLRVGVITLVQVPITEIDALAFAPDAPRREEQRRGARRGQLGQVRIDRGD